MFPILEVKNLSFKYGEIAVLDGLNFQVKSGEYVGLIGINGSGKTTLLRLLLGLLEPTSGSINLFGKPLKNFQNWSQVGYVPQSLIIENGFFPATVAEVISSNFDPKISKGLKPREALSEALKLAGVWEYKNQLISDLSGGQKQRVFIARSLINKPKLLILDEPTSGVDNLSKEGFYKFLHTLNTQEKLTIIFVSHDLETISKEAGRILCVDSHGIWEEARLKSNLEKEFHYPKIEHVHLHK